MARYIHCEKCNKEIDESAKNYGELYESIEGIALKDMLCDGACGLDGSAKPIKKGEKCYAAVLLNNRSHPTYHLQKPEAWIDGYILPIVTEIRDDKHDTDF